MGDLKRLSVKGHEILGVVCRVADEGGIGGGVLILVSSPLVADRARGGKGVMAATCIPAQSFRFPFENRAIRSD